MKKSPKKKNAKTEDGRPPLLIHLAEPEKTYVEVINDAIQANLIHLHAGIQACPAEAEKCVAALVDAAINAAARLESLYGSGTEDQRNLVKRVALRGKRFVGTYEFRLPTALRDKPRPFECPGDQMRRELTNTWQTSAPLRATGKTEYDGLRLLIEGFVSAVRNPDGARPVDTTAKASPGLDYFLESSGIVSVQENVRAGLLSPKAQRNPAKWAAAFVDWYESLHPWPFKDANGSMTWPKNNAKISDPLHRVALQRLASLRAGNPDEKSPLNALRAVARERFTAAFSEVKVKRGSAL